MGDATADGSGTVMLSDRELLDVAMVDRSRHVLAIVDRRR